MYAAEAADGKRGGGICFVRVFHATGRFGARLAIMMNFIVNLTVRLIVSLVEENGNWKGVCYSVFAEAVLAV